ncbi:MAG: hypothetical protein KF686_12330 [Ramlibacter sp.]|nr:hypothetical protein [Ramlibacter sp.]
MKTFYALFMAVLLAGCSSPPTLKEKNRASIEGIKQVEIFYNKEEHVVHYEVGQQTGQGMWTVGLLLGPLGPLAAGATQYAAVKAGVEATRERSKAFNEAANLSAGSQDMNQDLAEALAAQLREAGKVVKLTRVARLPGARIGETEQKKRAPDPLCAGGVCGTPGMLGGAGAPAPKDEGPRDAEPVAGNGYTPTPGYFPLLLRVTTGYGAPEIYAEYAPLAVVEWALIDDRSGRYLAQQKWAQGKPKPLTYANWDLLKADIPKARAQLRDTLLSYSPGLSKEIFSFEPNR